MDFVNINFEQLSKKFFIDYVLVLNKAEKKCEQVVNAAYAKLLPKGETASPEQKTCHHLNISACSITEGDDPVAVTVYNPIGKSLTKQVRLPVVSKNFEIHDNDGNKVEYSLSEIPEFVQKLPGRHSNATHEVVFNVQLPALGFVTYFRKSFEPIYCNQF